MLLIAMTLVLVVPGVMAGAAALIWKKRVPVREWMRVGVTLLFLATGIAHFVITDAMSQMIPPVVPFRVPLVYITGVFEIAGAIGIWVPRVARLAGFCLIALVIAVFPANLYTALTHVVIEGQQTDESYLLVRVPFEILLVVWIYYSMTPRNLSGAHPSA